MSCKKALSVILIILLVLNLPGCNITGKEPTLTDDEILLVIQLDVKEDIGLLVIDYNAEGFKGSGGVSNADKSLLKNNDLIYHTLDRNDYKGSSDVKNLSLRFTVITEYFQPNYDNIYPAECTKPLNEIYLDVKFGKSYYFTIIGDKTNGYKAMPTGN